MVAVLMETQLLRDRLVDAQQEREVELVARSSRCRSLAEDDEAGSV